MRPETCAVCLEEVRLATVAAHDDMSPGVSYDPTAPLAFNGGTAFLHRPGSPGDRDGHRPRFGNLRHVPIAATTGAADKDIQPEEDKAPTIHSTWTAKPGVVLSKLAGFDPYPTSAGRLMTNLVDGDLRARATLASALVVSASPATRGQRVRLLTIGVRASVRDRNVAALWELNEGSVRPAWKATGSWGWVVGQSAPERLPVADVLDFLTKTS